MSNVKLESELDFKEAMERQARIRVFQDDQVIDSQAVIIRYTDEFIVTQSGVSDISYHRRSQCEFYLMKKR